MKHLVLVDGHHMMYRAYWAIPRTLRTSKGEQVNTVFGMASMLLAILNKEQPDGLVVCFDEGDETFRHQENETYKDGRSETPDDFYQQIPRVMELMDAFGFPTVSDPQYEADDFLAAYAYQGEQAGMRSTIVSGDRDVFQMASKNITIAIPHKGYMAAEYLGPEEVKEKYGITPEQVASYKGLCGDSSDNLPGVKGIGPKGAAKLLQDYGTLENIYEHLDDIKPAIREKLERDREQAFFCERMAVLKTDITLPVALDDTGIDALPVEDIEAFFKEMEFTLLTKRLHALAGSDFGEEHMDASDMEAVEDDPVEKDEKEQLSLFQ